MSEIELTLVADGECGPEGIDGIALRLELMGEIACKVSLGDGIADGGIVEFLSLVEVASAEQALEAVKQALTAAQVAYCAALAPLSPLPPRRCDR